jgi:hypothetical protein
MVTSRLLTYNVHWQNEPSQTFYVLFLLLYKTVACVFIFRLIDRKKEDER